jgi:hypothetical protein
LSQAGEAVEMPLTGRTRTSCSTCTSKPPPMAKLHEARRQQIGDRHRLRVPL